MKKKLLSACIMLVFLVSFLASACAEDSVLSSIDLQLLLGSDRKVEVGDDLSAYSVFNDELTDIDNDLYIIILQRDAPEKRFTEKKTYPPFSDLNGFPDDFMGEDMGTGKVWLRADLMNRIPEYFRAGSLQEATYLIIADNIYLWGGTLSVTDFRNNTDEEMPEFESVEEMYEYFLTHQREIESVTYYPKFDAVSVVSLYDTKTKEVMYYGMNSVPAKRFARNPGASDLWDEMCSLKELLDSMKTDQSPDAEKAKKLLEDIDFVPQAKRDIWSSCMDAGEYSTAVYSMNEYYWNMATELKDMDPSEKNRNNYDLIIESKDAEALTQFVSFCDYSGFERSIASIEETKEYMASYDSEWMEDTLREFVNIFSEY